VLREQPRRRRVVGRHVSHPEHEHEVRAGADAPALLHARVGHRDGLISVEVLDALTVELHLHQHLQTADH
jgi:hypothetical protein